MKHIKGLKLGALALLVTLAPALPAGAADKDFYEADKAKKRMMIEQGQKGNSVIIERETTYRQVPGSVLEPASGRLESSHPGRPNNPYNWDDTPMNIQRGPHDSSR